MKHLYSEPIYYTITDTPITTEKFIIMIMIIMITVVNYHMLSIFAQQYFPVFPRARACADKIVSSYTMRLQYVHCLVLDINVLIEDECYSEIEIL